MTSPYAQFAILLSLAVAADAFVSLSPRLLSISRAAHLMPSFRTKMGRSELRMVAVAPEIQQLSELPLLPYLNEEGKIPFDASNGNVILTG